MRCELTLGMLIVVAALSGCVSTRTAAVDERAAQWHGKTVALTQRPSAGFQPITAGKMMFGLVGAALMMEKGKQIVAENGIDDPAVGIGRILLAAATEHYGVVAATTPLVVIDETDVQKLAKAASGADLLLDVQVVNWGFAYKPNLKHYFTFMSVKVRMIDVPNGTMAAEGFCHYDSRKEESLPTYDEMLAEHASLLKARLQTYSKNCEDEFREKVLAIPADKGVSPSVPTS